MASHTLSLLPRRSLASTASCHARFCRLHSSVIRTIPSSSPRTLPRSSTCLRSFSQTAHHAQRLDPHNNPLHVDYDASLGDPWAHYRLRKSKPLLQPRPPTPFASPAFEKPQEVESKRGGVLTGVLSVLRTTQTRSFVIASLLLGTFFFWYNTEIVPVSGRMRFNIIPDSYIPGSSDNNEERTLRDQERQGARRLPGYDPRVRQVQRVMNRLIPVVDVPGVTDWAVHVLHTPDLLRANAFVLPSGKVFVLTPLLRIAPTDDLIATVLSHEIAHILAKHSAERLSMWVGHTFFMCSTLLLLAPMGWKYWLFGGLGVHVALGLLFRRPMRRMLETEADYIGMMVMAEACYDPRATLSLWARLTQAQAQMGAFELPECVSTHPSLGTRLERTKKWLPEALDKREKSDCVKTQGFADAFRRAMERGQVLILGP